MAVCSRPEDGLRCRQGVKPPLKFKLHVLRNMHLRNNLMNTLIWGFFTNPFAIILRCSKVKRGNPNLRMSFTPQLTYHITTMPPRPDMVRIRGYSMRRLLNSRVFGPEICLYMITCHHWGWRCVNIEVVDNTHVCWCATCSFIHIFRTSTLSGTNSNKEPCINH